ASCLPPGIRRERARERPEPPAGGYRERSADGRADFESHPPVRNRRCAPGLPVDRRRRGDELRECRGVRDRRTPWGARGIRDSCRSGTGFRGPRSRGRCLRAIGAGNRWMRRRLLLESFPLALGAAVLGAGLGFLAESWLQPKASLVLFGHEVLVSFDLSTFAFGVLAVVAISMLSGLVLLRGAMATRPMGSIRA